jgi:hypothetical protein
VLVVVAVWVAVGFTETGIVSVAVDRARWHALNKNPNTKIKPDEIIIVWYLRMTQPY